MQSFGVVRRRWRGLPKPPVAESLDDLSVAPRFLWDRVPRQAVPVRTTNGLPDRPLTATLFVRTRIFGQTQHIGKEPVSSGYTFRELPVESIGVVDINSFAVPGIEQAAFLRRLPFVVCFEQRLIFRIPGLHPFRAALFHPSGEIFCRDFVRPVKNRVLPVKDLDLRSLVRNLLRVGGHGVGVWPIIMVELRRIVLHNHHATILYVIQDAAVVNSQIFTGSIGANAQEDNIVGA
jgi:hypothetical protein